MQTLAYATSIQAFLNNSILDERTASNFPGGSVWPAAREAAQARGWDFATADVVLERVQSGDLRPNDVRVIQEEDAPLGSALIDVGARASLLLCGESPLFAREFYRQLDRISAGFDNALLFRGALEKVAVGVSPHVLHFPGFSRGIEASVQPWDQRDMVVMVAGNKYWRHEGLPVTHRAREIWKAIKNRGHFEWLQQHQLHDRRLEYVAGLSEAGLLTLYGPGWNSFHHLPAHWRDRLSAAGVTGTELDYATKRMTIGGFKFTLCMENFEYPGYVTEKIVDVISAGSIPLYWGAPDIGDFIPSDVFVDLQAFVNPEELVAHIVEMDVDRGMSMIRRGQDFLSSAAGDVYSFQHQGELIVDIATS